MNAIDKAARHITGRKDIRQSGDPHKLIHNEPAIPVALGRQCLNKGTRAHTSAPHQRLCRN
jgi:hypothetical protein